AAAVDDGGAGPGADAREVGGEEFVVERAGHGRDGADRGGDREAGRFPTAVVRGDEDDATPAGHRLVYELVADEVARRPDLLGRELLHLDRRQRLSAHVAPALPDDRLRFVRALGKRGPEVLNRDAVPPPGEEAGEGADAGAP